VTAALSAPPNSVWHEPALVYVLQGRKCGQLGGQHFEVNAGKWLLIHLPQVMSCDTSELQGEPFLAMALSIDMELVAEYTDLAREYIDNHFEAIDRHMDKLREFYNG
jgi:hypothetical protein